MKNTLLYISFLMFSFVVFSQEKITDVKIDTTTIAQKKFDQQLLEDFKSQNDFNYNVRPQENNFLQNIWAWFVRVVKKVLSWFFDDIAPAIAFLASIVKAIPWIVLGLLLFLMLKFFLKMNSRKAVDVLENRFPIQLTSDAEFIVDQNLSALILQAIEDKNYRLAIRFYYLLVLQKLTEKKLILWQIEKTNEDYIQEVAHLEIAADFSETTRLYDFVWYGNFEMNEGAFLKAENRFHKLTKKILG